MNRFFMLLVFLLSCCIGSFAQNETDSMFVERVLHDAPDNAGTLHFAQLFLRRPYVAHTLEINDEEVLVVNTRQLDCTTLVENVVALTLCHQQKKRSYDDFCLMLQTLRYRQGILNGYTSRLHYFTDWIMDKTAMGIVKEIQMKEAPFTALQTVKVNYMSSHPHAYKALAAHQEFLSLIVAQERHLKGKTFRYIPKAEVKNTKLMRSVVKDGDILAITCSKPGLDIAHLGFAVWRDDGLHLLNASMLHHQVVEEPMTLRQYLYKHPSHTGVRVIRLIEK